MIFDIKLGENFRIKSQIVEVGYTTNVPASITYLSLVSRDSVLITLKIAALNGLDILACDIQNFTYHQSAGSSYGPQQDPNSVHRRS